MTRFLTRLLGRLPIGWLQLSHKPARFAAALAGVAFANILIFMQLGFLGALEKTTRLPYGLMDADILVSAPDARTLTDGGNVPRQRMFQALATPGVADAAPLYVGKLAWSQANGDSVNLHVYGVDPLKSTFRRDVVGELRGRLSLLDRVVVDSLSRGADPAVIEAFKRGAPHWFEANGRMLSVAGTFELGSGFDADGYLIASDQTFLKLFPGRSAGAPSHILLQVTPGADVQAVVQRLRNVLPARDTLVRTIASAARADQDYQTTERPVGLIFGFGVIIGVLVGVIIVYQVLSTDVADHLGEYATLKAVGYRQDFFLGVVFEEALVLAVIGFVPGLLVTLILYSTITVATGLPVAMTGMRLVMVLIGTTLMCMISGAIATRRLAAADPADLF